MAISSTVTIPVYGMASQKATTGEALQTVSETLLVSATANSRRAKGPKKGGRWTFHFFNETASGGGSTLSFGYSNLPDPDPTNDAHWVDSGITAIVLTTTATGTFTATANVEAQWIRFKMNVATSAGKVWGWYNAEGLESH
jgi:hypothetical protein